jgi:hypothetical protein
MQSKIIKISSFFTSTVQIKYGEIDCFHYISNTLRVAVEMAKGNRSHNCYSKTSNLNLCMKLKDVIRVKSESWNSEMLMYLWKSDSLYASEIAWYNKINLANRNQVYMHVYLLSCKNPTVRRRLCLVGLNTSLGDVVFPWKKRTDSDRTWTWWPGFHQNIKRKIENRCALGNGNNRPWTRHGAWLLFATLRLQ